MTRILAEASPCYIVVNAWREAVSTFSKGGVQARGIICSMVDWTTVISTPGASHPSRAVNTTLGNNWWWGYKGPGPRATFHDGNPIDLRINREHGDGFFPLSMIPR